MADGPTELTNKPMTQPNPEDDATIAVSTFQDHYPVGGPVLGEGVNPPKETVIVRPDGDDDDTLLDKKKPVYSMSYAEIKLVEDPTFHPEGMEIPINCDTINGRWVMRSNVADGGRTFGPNKNVDRYPLKLYLPGCIVRNLGDKNRGTISMYIKPFFCYTRNEWCVRVIWHADAGSPHLNLQFSLVDYPLSQLVPDIDMPRAEHEHVEKYSIWAKLGQPIGKISRQKVLDVENLKLGQVVPFFKDEFGIFLCRDPKEAAIWIRPSSREGVVIEGMEHSSQMMYNADLGDIPKKDKRKNPAPVKTVQSKKRKNDFSDQTVSAEQLDSLQTLVTTNPVDECTPSNTPVPLEIDNIDETGSHAAGSVAAASTDSPLKMNHSDDGTRGGKKNKTVNQKLTEQTMILKHELNTMRASFKADLKEELKEFKETYDSSLAMEKKKAKEFLSNHSLILQRQLRETVDGGARDSAEGVHFEGVLKEHLTNLRKDVTNDVVDALKSEGLVIAKQSLVSKTKHIQDELPQSPTPSGSAVSTVSTKTRPKKIKVVNPETAKHNPYAKVDVPGTLALSEIPTDIPLELYFSELSLNRIRNEVLHVTKKRRKIQCRAKSGFKSVLFELATHKHFPHTYGYDRVVDSLKKMLLETRHIKEDDDASMEHLRTNPWLWAGLEYLKGLSGPEWVSTNELFSQKQLRLDKKTGRYKWIDSNLRAWLKYGKAIVQHARNAVASKKLIWVSDDESATAGGDSTKARKKKPSAKLSTKTSIKPVDDSVSAASEKVPYVKPGPRFSKTGSKQTKRRVSESSSDGNGDSSTVASRKRKEKMPKHKRELKLQELDTKRKSEVAKRQIPTMAKVTGASERKKPQKTILLDDEDEEDDFEEPIPQKASTPSKLKVSKTVVPVASADDDERKSLKDDADDSGEDSDDDSSGAEDVSGSDDDNAKIDSYPGE